MSPPVCGDLRRRLRKPGLLTACALSGMALCGCYSSMSVRPHVEAAKPPHVVVCGEIKYSGNARYLPSTVSGCGNGAAQHTITFSHGQDYIGTSVEAEIALSMLPSYIVGSPTGKDKVYVYSQLNVHRGDTNVATYSAACVKESYRSIFSGAVNHSEGRAQCLDALRVNIENQMLRDEQFWTRHAER